jgi:hypothetical protein
VVDRFIPAETLSVISVGENLKNLKRVKLAFKMKCATAQSLVAVESAYQSPLPLRVCLDLIEHISIRQPFPDFKDTAEKVGVAERVKVNKRENEWSGPIVLIAPPLIPSNPFRPIFDVFIEWMDSVLIRTRKVQLERRRIGNRKKIGQLDWGAHSFVH